MTARRADEHQAATAWIMLSLAFLATNGGRLTMGSYGILVPQIESVTGASRTLSTSGLPLALLTTCALAPFVGVLCQKLPIHWIMVTGAVLSSAGFLALSFTTDIYVILAIYAVMIGPGVLLIGTLPASTIVNSWFTNSRGKALAAANLPLVTLVVPFMTSWALSNWGLRGAFLMLALVAAALTPAVAIMRRREGAAPATAPGATPATAIALTAKDLVSDVRFWLICGGSGVMMGAGTIILSHLVPLLAERGVARADAPAFLATFGGAGLVGGLVAGALADRFGPPRTLLLLALVQAGLWLAFLGVHDMGLLVVLIAGMGLFNGGVFVTYTSALATTFGVENFSRALGLTAVITTVFLFGAAPVAGLIYDAYGHYGPALSAQIGGFAAAAVLFLTLILRRQALPSVAATPAE